MAAVAPLTRAELRDELDRTLKHYATKADVAELKADLVKWMVGLMLGSVTAAVSIAVAVDRLWTP